MANPVIVLQRITFILFRAGKQARPMVAEIAMKKKIAPNGSESSYPMSISPRESIEENKLPPIAISRNPKNPIPTLIFVTLSDREIKDWLPSSVT